MINKLLSILLAFVLIICVILCYNKIYRLKQLNKLLDISTFDLPQCDIFNNKKIWLITYANGKVYEKNARVLLSSAIHNCVNTVRLYKEIDIDSEFYNKYQNILKNQRGAGFWLWKPYFILKTLEEMPEGDILVYADSGMKLINPITKLVKQMIEETKDIILFHGKQWKNIQEVKRAVFKYYDLDEPEYHNAHQLVAGFGMFVNNKKTREFIKKWLNDMTHIELIDDTRGENEYPEFIGNKHDQAILSMLSFVPNNKKKYKIGFRQIDFQSENAILCLFHRTIEKTIIPVSNNWCIPCVSDTNFGVFDLLNRNLYKNK